MKYTRIHNTLEKITDGKKWLILIDELFKGTNVQDAMKCSTVVIQGLRKMKNTLFILSTHLYEIGEELKHIPISSSAILRPKYRTISFYLVTS
jgi:DNA mismatch repair ATPase MutS